MTDSITPYELLCKVADDRGWAVEIRGPKSSELALVDKAVDPEVPQCDAPIGKDRDLDRAAKACLAQLEQQGIWKEAA